MNIGGSMPSAFSFAGTSMPTMIWVSRGLDTGAEGSQ